MRSRLAAFFRLFPLALALMVLAVCFGAAAPAGADAPGAARALRALLVAQQAQLTAADPAYGDFWFGDTVAISGATAVVGAPHTPGDRGSVYVFVRSGTTWSQQARLTAADGANDDQFGRSIAISGDTIVVGARGDDVGANIDQGSAYVFVRSGTTWSQQARLTAADGAAYDRLGDAVAISGDTVVVGAIADDVGAIEDQGSAYVFVRNGTTWSQQARLTAADGAYDDQFGRSVSISGATVVVGAPRGEVGTTTDQGAAYVFVRSAAGWSRQAKLTALDGAADDWFGYSVGISGANVVVGAPGGDVGANVNQGVAYTFMRSGAKWSRLAKMSAADAGDFFGESTAISGASFLVGAPYDDVGDNADQGSASVFRIARPARPTARSPKGRISSRRPVFRWRAAAGAAAYEVRIYKGGKQIKKKTGITRTSWKCTKRLPRQAWLTWKVRARNVAGYGAWSGKLRFKVR